MPCCFIQPYGYLQKVLPLSSHGTCPHYSSFPEWPFSVSPSSFVSPQSAFERVLNLRDCCPSSTDPGFHHKGIELSFRRKEEKKRLQMSTIQIGSKLGERSFQMSLFYYFYTTLHHMPNTDYKVRIMVRDRRKCKHDLVVFCYV